MGRVSEGRTPRVLGITGPIGCGKTTVGDILLTLGARERIDDDRIVHKLLAPGTSVTVEVAQAFGPDVLLHDGSIDRAALAGVVFANRAMLRRLEAIVHPAVRETVRQQLDEIDDRGVVVLDAIRLLQSELLELCEAVWVVTCDPGAQMERLTGPRGMTADEAEKRREAMPFFEHPRVTRVIVNSGSRDDLENQVRLAWTAFQKRC